MGTIESKLEKSEKKRFNNIGKCDDGHKIGNCPHCNSNGVLISKHECPVKENPYLYRCKVYYR